jgi:hypothetical protein
MGDFHRGSPSSTSPNNHWENKSIWPISPSLINFRSRCTPTIKLDPSASRKSLPPKTCLLPNPRSVTTMCEIYNIRYRSCKHTHRNIVEHTFPSRDDNCPYCHQRIPLVRGKTITKRDFCPDCKDAERTRQQQRARAPRKRCSSGCCIILWERQNRYYVCRSVVKNKRVLHKNYQRKCELVQCTFVNSEESHKTEIKK